MDQQVGGKMINEGKYGCIFNPPLLCENQPVSKGRNKVGKITRGHDSKNEIHASEILRTLSDWSKYFILAESKTLCKPKSLEKQKEDDIYMCEVAQESEFSDLVQFEMPLGGKSVFERLTKSELKPDTFHFFEFVQDLLEGASLMVIKNLVHYDLHPGNILFDKNLKPKIIDFGESFSVREITEARIYDSWKIYTPEFANEPPEITLATGVRKGYSIKECCEEIIYEKHSIKLASIFLGSSLEKQKESLTHFYETSKAFNNHDWLNLWKIYWPVFDSWSLGSIFIHMTHRFLRDGTLQKMRDFHKRSPILKIVLGKMLKVNPRERYDCLEALNLYDPTNGILQTEAAKKWLERRQLSRAAA